MHSKAQILGCSEGLPVAGRRCLAAAALAILTACLLILAPLEHGEAAQGGVRGCKPFVLAKFHDEFGTHRFRAWDVKRSSHLRCTMTRRLLKAAYGAGPLKVIRKVYEPGGSGRPTYWLKNGWRCTNGAGGAVCFNVEKPIFNVIEGYGRPMAVTASTG